MELYAVIDALRSLHHINSVVEVRSDSTYVVKCFTDKWWQGWLTRGWKNSQRQAVANQDLWEQLLAEVVKRGSEKTFFTWVKGHSGEPMNDLVDALAVAAASA
jgi:ribonuclease HI